MNLRLSILLAFLCGCQKSQPTMEKAESDMRKALNEARMKSSSTVDVPEQKTAESIELDNTLRQAEFNLRRELNRNP